MLEPYVLKGTRTVLRRGETSNCLFLFDLISPPHPHKKKYRHYPLKCAIHPRLKEAGEFLHNKVKLMGEIKLITFKGIVFTMHFI